MQSVVSTQIPEQESVSLQTKKMTAKPVIPELALAQEGRMTTPLPVATQLKHRSLQIMGKSISKPWGTFWFSDGGSVTVPVFPACLLKGNRITVKYCQLKKQGSLELKTKKKHGVQ